MSRYNQVLISTWIIVWTLVITGVVTYYAPNTFTVSCFIFIVLCLAYSIKQLRIIRRLTK